MKKPEPNFVAQPTPSTYFTNRANGSQEMNWGPVADHGDTVPNDCFYIHSRDRAPAIDIATYRLEVDGSALKSPRSFTYDQILALPPVTCRRTLDCGANCRAFFPKISPYKSQTWLPVGFTQWHFGAVGAAEWTVMWARFELSWEKAEPGRYRLMTRATDEAGNTQPRPEDVIWNQHGMGYHGHAPLELSVLPLSNKP